VGPAALRRCPILGASGATRTWPPHILGLPALDDDEILQRILIRAAILADDDKIASSKLLKQIRG
jgi:hypothetical protein